MCLGTAYLTIAHAPLGNKVQNHCLSLFQFHTVYAGAYWHKMYGICACAFAEQRNRQYFRHVLFDCFGKIFLSLSVLPV